jgi:spore coat protein Y
MSRNSIKQGDCLSQALLKVLKQQKHLNHKHNGRKDKKIIPIMLYMNNGAPFSAYILDKRYGCVRSTFFQIVNFEENTDCLTLSVLIPIDMEGCPVDFCPDIYSLFPTKECITIDVKCICGVESLSPCLVNRFIPPIEPKC